MSKKQNVILSGLGFYQLSLARQKMLLRVLLISLGIHVVGLAVFGGMKVLESFRDETAVFEVPPPTRTYEPRQMEHRVKVQQQQRSASRPQVRPRMVSTRPSALALPEIQVDPKLVTASFQPNFRAVTGVGMGVGMGTGHGLGGLGTGASQFDFFGIRGRGSRIAILVDLSISMVMESYELGVTDRGIRDFRQVKRHIGRVIDALGESTMFNVIVYAEAVSAWQPEMQVANDRNKRDAKRFLEPFNDSISQLGHRTGNFTRSEHGLQTGIGGMTRLDLALTKAMKTGADTILVITDGDAHVLRPLSDAERETQRQAVERWRRENERASGPGDYVEERVWVPAQEARAAIIRERGGVAAREAREGRWEVRQVRRGGGGGGQPPRFPDPTWDLDMFIRHMNLLHEQLYQPRGQPMPVLHIIGYRTDEQEWVRFNRNLARHFKGNYRRVSSVN